MAAAERGAERLEESERRPVMQQYWVVGGEYTDTRCHNTVGRDETWIGPFDSYDAAMAEWSKHAWHTVDDCHTRYRIEAIDKDAPPPCTD